MGFIIHLLGYGRLSYLTIVWTMVDPIFFLNQAEWREYEEHLSVRLDWTDLSTFQ